ncbi:hypothetical protein [Streptomyces sp. NBC_00576]|nr:hypothetical protein [Streptomyces sp. NBC_00576]WUB76323.1 hypothetical protein OG734_43275 [Streptomyces sp. NBC_00576]
MKPVWFTILKGSDVEELELTDIGLGVARPRKAEARGLGRKLRFS